MTASPDTGATRVAVVVESFIVPQWVEWTVARIAATPGMKLAAVVPAAQPGAVRGAPRRRRSADDLTYRLYEWADRRVFGAAGALRDADLAPVAGLAATSSAIGRPDVVVSFRAADRTAWDGPAPRHGVWAIAPLDDGRPTSAPDRFWELRGRTGTGRAAVVALEDGRARVIAEDAVRTDPLSLSRTRERAAWTSARLVLHCLRLLRRDGRPAGAGDAPAEPRRLPPPAVTVAHGVRTALRGVAAKGRKAWLRDEWFVAVRARASDGRTDGPGPVRALPNPPGRYLGDPFPIEVDGRHFLFVEDYAYATRRGVISVSEAGPDGEWSPPRRVLESDHHLSYPFVFEHEGAVYMLPETGEAGRIELHRAMSFPDRWRLERVLLDGLVAVDATLHVDDGRLWLFANVMEGREDRGRLWLFSAPSLDAEWRPHPRNPIVTDPSTARPAGRLFRRGGVLIRPGQDCARAYGEAVVLNRVDVLSPDDYRETPVDRIEPGWLTGVERTHTYTFDSRFECLDGYRHVRRLRVRTPGKRSVQAQSGAPIGSAPHGRRIHLAGR
jgi:hypothetical protein